MNEPVGMFSKQTLARIFNISRATMYRVIERAGLPPKNLYSLKEVEEMLPYIGSIDSIYTGSDGKPRIKLHGGSEVVLEGKTGEMLANIVQNFLTGQGEMRQNETGILPVITNLTQQVAMLVETTKDLVARMIKLEDLLLQRAIGKPQEDIVKTRKAISLAVDDYIRSNNLLWSNKDDIFLELLQRYEKEKNIQIRRQYRKEDKTYINTIIRLNLAEDFISFVRSKC
ncbi:MAG: hypothetical protein ABDH28_00720 [Brevinematia bacterium]